LADQDLPALYSQALAFVYPSLYEGFGLPALEAMACGAPVITSRIPVIMETVGDAARLVEPRDVRELTEALVELLTQPGARTQLSVAGLQRAGEFTWERTAQMTLEVYRETLKAVPRHARPAAKLRPSSQLKSEL